MRIMRLKRKSVWWLISGIGFLFSLVLALVLVQTGDSKEALFQQLRSPDAATQQAAAEALSEIAHKNLERILPLLMTALKDPDPDVRFYSVVALWGAAYGDEKNARRLHQAVPALIEALRDEDARVREGAANCIGLVMPHPPAVAVTPLVELLNDPEPKVRKAALGGLAGIRRVDSEVSFAVLGVLEQDESRAVRGEAAKVLGEFRASDPAVVSALIDALNDTDKFVRQRAILALGKIGSPASAALGELNRIAQNVNEDQTIRKYAVYAIRSIERK